MLRQLSSLAAGLSVILSMAGCAASLGPGYLVETQEIRVSFMAQPQPVIRVSADYRLENTGNQPLDSLTVRLPGRRFRPDIREASWDGIALSGTVSPENPRDTLFRFPQSWKIAETHTLKFSYEISSASTEDGAVAFSSDAFYLPAEGWTPELPQAPGLFGFGGVPPKKWNLLVDVPAGFLVHASGQAAGRPAGQSRETRFRFVQTEHDFNPFVIAGRYRETQQDLDAHQKIRIWSRSQPDGAALRLAGESLRQTIKAYDSLLGPRGSSRPTMWIVECPASVGCISLRGSGYAFLVEGHAPDRYADLASRDTLLVEPGAPPERLKAAVGPALAAGWLGYGQNPGFYEQQPPMSALPAFAAALARETISGPQTRREIIARALAEIPQHASQDSARNPAVTRAKSLLLFYALQDRVGPEAFRKALEHMLYARQSRGFDVADLISALEQESHQTVGPFVREWIKRPGVPDEFRAQYGESAVVEKSQAEEAIR